MLGRLIQRYTFVDFKIAMRSMLATKGRGASTLLALVVGIFTLSLVAMLADSVAPGKAQAMFDAVNNFGPKWGEAGNDLVNLDPFDDEDWFF